MQSTGLLYSLQHSGLSSLIGSSRYVTMGIQTIHVLAFTLLLAVVFAFNLRVQKIALRSVSVGRFTQSLARSYRLGLLFALGAGVLLFLPRAIAYGHNWALDYKLGLLAVAIVLQFLSQRRALGLTDGHEASPFLRVVAVLSLLLWFTVAAAGRAIGFI